MESSNENIQSFGKTLKYEASRTAFYKMIVYSQNTLNLLPYG